jgi:hypothetical protein
LIDDYLHTTDTSRGEREELDSVLGSEKVSAFELFANSATILTPEKANFGEGRG